MDLYRKRDNVADLPMRLCIRVKFLVYGTIGAVWEWLNGEFRLSAEELALWLFEMVPDEMMN